VTADLPIRLVLIDPPAGVDFGIQRGHGSDCEVVGVQRSSKGSLVFDFVIRVADDGKSAPNFTGPFAQGPRDGRFFYVSVGTCAGQAQTPWSRRMKVPLAGVSRALVRQARGKPGSRLRVSVTETGKDGGPNCATVKPVDGWKLVSDK
jgi:hypothetical protein